jgi:hypothetical protein
MSPVVYLLPLTEYEFWTRTKTLLILNGDYLGVKGQPQEGKNFEKVQRKGKISTWQPSCEAGRQQG